jgi:hypothetical protein
MTMTRTSNTIGGFIEECCKDKEILACKTSKEVFKVINTCLQKAYRGEASRGRIAFIAEDIAESVCLKLNVDWTGI